MRVNAGPWEPGCMVQWVHTRLRINGTKKSARGEIRACRRHQKVHAWGQPAASAARGRAAVHSTNYSKQASPSRVAASANASGQPTTSDSALSKNQALLPSFRHSLPPISRTTSNLASLTQPCDRRLQRGRGWGGGGFRGLRTAQAWVAWAFAARRQEPMGCGSV